MYFTTTGAVCTTFLQFFLFSILSNTTGAHQVPFSAASYDPPLPDVTNKTIVLGIAELAANAYHYPDMMGQSAWRNTTNLFTYEYSYGWEVDGLRGHIFKSRDFPAIVFSVKGTTLNSKKDKESANLICSCNCCFSNCTNSCDKDRLLESLPNMYLSLLLLAYEDAKRVYPGYAVWFTGHSMGSVIASLAAIKTCNPAVGFSSPGEQLFADRIDLKHNCPELHRRTVHHIGYYKDPIFTGTCGWLCSAVGYRMESLCHHGTECTYVDAKNVKKFDDNEEKDDGKSDEDVEDMLGSGMIYKHTINFLIDKVIMKNEKVPECIPVTNCTEKCSI